MTNKEWKVIGNSSLQGPNDKLFYPCFICEDSEGNFTSLFLSEVRRINTNTFNN